jgi:hypothetical protein
VLRPDCHFESGHLDLGFQTGFGSVRPILEYDRHTSDSCQWFYFQINNDTKYTFVISGFPTSHGVFACGSKMF